MNFIDDLALLAKILDKFRKNNNCLSEEKDKQDLIKTIENLVNNDIITINYCSAIKTWVCPK